MSNQASKLIMGMALMMSASMDHHQEREKERILDEWDKSRQLPRKKKKARRKELILDWSIANWKF